MPEWVNAFINGIIAIGTLVTSLFTWRAATRAAKSAELTQFQFEMNKEQYDRERSPKIIPISETYSKGATDLDVCLNGREYLGINNSDIQIRLINVGLGNAYSVEVELLISNLKELFNVGLLNTPLHKPLYLGCPYEITFQESKFKYLRIDFQEEKRLNGSSTRTINFNDNLIHKTVVYSKDEISFNLSDFQHILFIHKLYSQFANKPDNQIEPQFELSIRYKSEAQLGGSLYENEKYEIRFQNLRTSFIPARNIFRVDFNHIPK